ncbi:porin [Comamonas testosteroni]|uniref:Porin n=1 Tax=Comamonas testosteroni TaxID=285 RepID=A0A096FE70_COMTE|nr:porin [Comamonas testosteroni]
MYGLVDASVGSFKGNATGVGALDRRITKADSGGMSTSHFGLRGREDLGGGVGVAFELSAFFRNDTGSAGRSDAIGPPVNVQTDPFWARASWVGISSQDWGQLRLGNAATQLFVNSITSNAFGDSTVFSPLNLVTHIGAQQAGGTSWANQLIYDSPNFSGVRFSVAHSFSEGRGANSSARVLYEPGPWTASLVWQAAKKDPLTFADGTTNNDMKTIMLGGSYDFGAAKVFAHVGRIQNDGTSAVPQDVAYRVAEVSVAVPVGSGRILAGYALRKTSDMPVPVPSTAAGGNIRRAVLTVAYDHQMSKRTDVYALVMSDRTKTLALPVPLSTVGASGVSAVVGIRHRF